MVLITSAEDVESPVCLRGIGILFLLICKEKLIAFFSYEKLLDMGVSTGSRVGSSK